MAEIDWVEISNIWFAYHRTAGWRPVCEAGWSKEDHERAIFTPGYFTERLTCRNKHALFEKHEQSTIR